MNELLSATGLIVLVGSFAVIGYIAGQMRIRPEDEDDRKKDP